MSKKRFGCFDAAVRSFGKNYTISCAIANFIFVVQQQKKKNEVWGDRIFVIGSQAKFRCAIRGMWKILNTFYWLSKLCMFEI